MKNGPDFGVDFRVERNLPLDYISTSVLEWKEKNQREFVKMQRRFLIKRESIVNVFSIITKFRCRFMIEISSGRSFHALLSRFRFDVQVDYQVVESSTRICSGI